MNPLNETGTGGAAGLLDVARVEDARPDRPLIGDPVLGAGDRALNKAERAIEKGLPRQYNPLAYTGALAGYSFIIATVSGILLLFWYSPSVHTAYSSVQAMDAQWWGAGFVRSLHRYSSDACVLFAIIHAVKVFVARKFTGARWIAWVSGLALLGLIWLDGWLGYWLTWDQRAQAVAVGTAEVLDALPIFPEPISRSFLTNDSINSLIFFAVFFAHVLLPIPIAVVIWIHLVRLKKPRFLPRRGLMIATGIVMIALSLLFPAGLAEPADMSKYPEGFSIDWFYLAPLYLMDRVGGVWFWVVALGALFALSSLPWLMAPRRRKAPAKTNQDICNGCEQCYVDCPYEAISMVAMEGRNHLVSLVDPSRCVSCGVCVGSCDPGAMTYPELNRTEVRNRVMNWLKDEEGPHAIAFLCADGAGRKVRFDRESGLSDDLPGYRVVGIPCAAWLHSSFAEIIARRGGRTLLIACDSSEPRCRLGAEITAERVAETREPEFDASRIPAGTFQFAQIETGGLAELKATAAAFLDRKTHQPRKRPGAWKTLTSATVTVLILAALTVVFSNFVYVAPARPPSMLVVSFKHAGQAKAQGGDVESELGHLKGMKERTELSPVRLKVLVNGELVHEETYEPRGIRNDSASVGTVRIPVRPGRHSVEIMLGETDDPDEWTHRTVSTVEFTKSHRRVVRFDTQHGYEWD